MGRGGGKVQLYFTIESIASTSRFSYLCAVCAYSLYLYPPLHYRTLPKSLTSWSPDPLSC